MLLKELLTELDRICPFNYQEDFDNSGLQLGNNQQPCQNILLAFDFTEAILNEAIAKKADVIITHHPFLFRAIKTINTDDCQGKLIFKLIEHKIALIALHTNLDKIDYGVNINLAKNLGLRDVAVFLPEESGVGLGATGNLDTPLAFGEFTKDVKHKLNQSHIKFVGNPNKSVSKIGVLGGAGAEFLDEAKAQGLDVYISSDFKYHDAQKAQNLDICIIDAGHFGTEVGVIASLRDKLSLEFPALNIRISENITDYWQYE